MSPLSFQELTSGLPLPRRVEPVPANQKIVVLDDDPTGTQTVHGIPVLTRWKREDLEQELVAPGPGFYVLTNSRALKPNDAVMLAADLGRALRGASQATGVPFSVVSRGDSTLRGHYPAETDALVTALGGGFSGTILIPALFSGGRITIGDIHYARIDDGYVPVGETEFARDPSFGFRSSNLRDYIAEKTAGAIPRESVISISIKELRTRDPADIATKLRFLPTGGAAIVNAAEPSDLCRFTHALAREELAGRRFIFRTAADFVAAYLCIPKKELLCSSDLVAPGATNGGLLVAGSYVGQTSRQLDALAKACPEIDRIELVVPRLLDPEARETELARCRRLIDGLLRNGRSAVLFTSRELIRASETVHDLDVGAQVSAAIVELVSTLTIRPAWLIAKGGITSSDIATKALGIVRAMVLGQALPGVPVWSCGPECKWPGLSYVVFPGNVGGVDALSQIVGDLTGSGSPDAIA